MIVTSRVRKVTKRKVPTTKVYDLEVPKYSNFMLANGIVVHNSKDISDGVCGALWGAVTDTKQNDIAEILYSNQQEILSDNDVSSNVTYNNPKIRMNAELFSELDNYLGDDDFYDDY